MYFFAVQAPFTHGEDGIQAVPRGKLFGFLDLADQTNMYVTVLVAFVLSATFAGVAGATKALVFQLASLTDVDWPVSGEVILMTLVGGLGTLFGPVAGAFFIVTLENYLTTIGQWVFVVQGVIFVVCVLLFRRGIIGELAHLLRVKL
jgi:branched-chain amino acid transport system permease protein